ncbi:N-acetyltransferase family protein [Candidatus Palauibacter sp.]|uniref:GNAT family N-acetyltransferase n=1 Tax=Candidatus Palauibacter sp. TaxID=3101350 RepID=UPI003AF1E517
MIEIRPLRPEDWDGVRTIYVQGMETGDATFETEAPSWASWDREHLAACPRVGIDDPGFG